MKPYLYLKDGRWFVQWQTSSWTRVRRARCHDFGQACRIARTLHRMGVR